MSEFSLISALVDWAAHGLLHASWWQVLIYGAVVTHITIASVTIFLHRSQAPRQVRDRRRPAQPGHPRHRDRAAQGRRALPRRGQGPGDDLQVRPQHAR